MHSPEVPITGPAGTPLSGLVKYWWNKTSLEGSGYNRVVINSKGEKVVEVYVPISSSQHGSAANLDQFLSTGYPWLKMWLEDGEVCSEFVDELPEDVE